MFAYTNLPFTLSAEDTKVFQGLQRSALLPELAVPGEGQLVQFFKEQQKKMKKEQMEPYADILLEQVSNRIHVLKDSLIEQIQKSPDFSLDILSWNTVQYNESFSQMKMRENEMSPADRMAHSIKKTNQSLQIQQDGLEDYLAVNEYDGYVTFPAVKVDRIFRFTDLAIRIALLLGPNFFPITRTSWHKTVPAENIYDGYDVMKKTLAIRYYPFGVNKYQMQRLLSVAKEQTERYLQGKTSTLSSIDYVEGFEKIVVLRAPKSPPASPVSSPVAEEDEYADMPPLIPASSLRGKW